MTEILAAARTHIGADAVFLTRFEDGAELFLLGNGDVTSFGPVREGGRMPLSETYGGQMLAGRLPPILADTSSSSIAGELRMTHEAGVGAFVLVPIHLDGGSVYGSLCCLRRSPDSQLQERNLDFLRLLSSLAAHEIERADETEKLLQAQLSVARALADWTTLDEALTALLEAVATAMGWTAALLWAREYRGKELRMRARWGANHGQAGEAEVTGASVGPDQLVKRAWTQAGPLAAPGTRGGADHRIAFRVMNGEAVVAVIEGAARERREALTQTSKRALLAIGAQIGQTFDSEALAVGGPVLTAREITVLQLAADGVSRSETAAMLHISETTVATHFRNVFAKIGASDRAAAVAFALRRRLIR